MKYKMFVIYDSKAEAFDVPRCHSTRGVAIRSFVDAAVKADVPWKDHPEDYTLFEVGEYDGNKCKFEIYDTPKSLGLALELMDKTES